MECESFGPITRVAQASTLAPFGTRHLSGSGALPRPSPQPMSDLQHRIRLFVYRFDGNAPSYLLLRRSEGVNPTWGPIDGPIEFHEQIETAILREVQEDVGLSPPEDVVDLQMPKHWTLGDEEVIEWPYGVKVVAPSQELSLDPRWSASRWTDFSQAYTELCLEIDRAAVTRLHTLITAA